MKESRNFLENWCNDTKNDGYEQEEKEYGEKEVEDMLYEYKIKLSSYLNISFCKDAGNTTCPYERIGGVCGSPVNTCSSKFTK